MALKFLSDVGLPPPRVLAYGPKGSGKTSSLATLNKISMNGGLLMSEYGNLAPYFQRCKALGVEPLPANRICRVDTYSEILEAIDYFTAEKVDWLGHDSLSADSKMFEVEQFPLGKAYGDNDSFSKWKLLADRLQEVCKRIKDGPWKFAVTVGLEEHEGSYAGVFVHGRKSRLELTPWAFNGMAHFSRPTADSKGNSVHQLNFAPDGMWDVTCQFSTAEAIKNGPPDWYEIFKKAGRL